MKHKTSELSGALLDAAVAIADGATDVRIADFGNGPECITSVHAFEPVPFNPSTRWADGGPIIERERIETSPMPHGWLATPSIPPIALPDGGHWHVQLQAPTLLVAAMRAYCASKFGEEVELP